MRAFKICVPRSWLLILGVVARDAHGTFVQMTEQCGQEGTVLNEAAPALDSRWFFEA